MADPRRAEYAQSIVRMVALHDPETAAHLGATAALAQRIAGSLRLGEDVAERIELAALLHDIGKIGIRRDVLCKRSELTTAEWDEMRMHAQMGADTLADWPLLADVAPIVRAHHERLDGCGYPDRLRGDEITIEVRVVAVADAFHALTTDRAYRRAVPTGAAISVLIGAAGPQFDPDVVAATLAIFAPASVSHKRSA